MVAVRPRAAAAVGQCALDEQQLLGIGLDRDARADTRAVLRKALRRGPRDEQREVLDERREAIDPVERVALRVARVGDVHQHAQRHALRRGVKHRHERVPVVRIEGVARRVVARRVEHEQRAALRRGLPRERFFERGDMEAAVAIEHRERLDAPAGDARDRVVGPPVERRRQQRLPDLEEVGDRERERTRSARRRDRARVRQQRRRPEHVLAHRVEERPRPGDRRIARAALGREPAVGLQHGRQRRQAQVLVEQHAQRRVDDRLAGGAAAVGLGVEREDRIVPAADDAAGDQAAERGRLHGGKTIRSEAADGNPGPARGARRPGCSRLRSPASRASRC